MAVDATHPDCDVAATEWARARDVLAGEDAVNRKVKEALIQGVETARAVLTTTPQSQAADTQFVKWLMDHQKEAGVFTTVSGLVEQLTDNPAAKMAAQEIAERVHKSRTQPVGAGTTAAS